MKTILIFALVILISFDAISQVGIGTSNPNQSAQLDVGSTNKGFLPPRMAGFQRDNIVNPAAGLIIWCSTCGTTGELQVFNGSAWTNMIGGIASSSKPDSLISFKIPAFYNIDTLQAIYSEGFSNLDYYFYGIRNNNGEVVKLTSALIKKKNSIDTVQKIIYDDSLRVKNTFLMINGILDTTMFKFTYTDTSTFLTRLNINWTTNSIEARQIIELRKGNNQILSNNLLRFNSLNDTINFNELQLYVAGHQAYIFRNFILVGAWTAIGAGLCGLCWPFFTVGSALYVFNETAHASESLTYIQVSNPSNPQTEFHTLMVNNPEWDWCNFMVTYKQPYEGGVAFSTSLSSGNHMLFVHHIQGSIQMCQGTFTSGSIGSIFLVEQGYTCIFFENGACGVDYILGTFKCD